MSAAKEDQELCAVVLAGGKSTRMGQDKTRVRVNGRTLVQHMVDLAGIFCSKIYVVGQNPELEPRVGWMLDEIPGIGPMGGIITALNRLNSPCLVLACDLPCLEERLLSRLLMHREKKDTLHCLTTFCQEHTAYIETLVAVYETDSLDLLLASYRRGCYKLSRAIPENRRLHVPYAPEEKRFFFNVNYPDELEKIISGIHLDN